MVLLRLLAPVVALALCAIQPLCALAHSGAVVARVLGIELTCDALGADELPTCAQALLRDVRHRVEQDFIARQGLQATEDELATLKEYNRAFERHDRTQRARKLAQLEARLASSTLEPDEHDRLNGFRSILQRLARYDAEVDAGIEERDSIPVEVLRSWIERAKLNAVLYERYGGVIGLTASGPYAHGAGAALIAEYIARKRIEILDLSIEQRFDQALHAPPRMRYSGSAPDFTPFWQRPIPASYLPE